MRDLPDVNVWLALVNQSHQHHQRASDYFAHESQAVCAFCRITMLGLARLLMNSAVMAGNPLSCKDAMALQQSLLAVESVEFLSEPIDIEAQLTRLIEGRDCSHRLWTDAYLAAFAISGGLRLVSFDGGVSRFSGLNFLHLAA